MMLVIDKDSGPVVGYFAVLGLAFVAVLVSWQPFRCQKGSLMGLVAFPFALNSLYVCWSAIFAFMAQVSKEKGCGPGHSPVELLDCNSPQWQEFDVFVQAYVDVTKTLVGWMSSSQLLMFVLSGCTFLHMECARLEVSRVISVSYIIVGFLGAISLAFPLLFAHLYVISLNASDKTKRNVAGISFPLAMCNILAMMGVILLPMTFETHRRTIYTGALLLVHFILGLPCLWGKPTLVIKDDEKERENNKLAGFYLFLAGACFLMHLSNVFRAVLFLHGQQQGLNDVVKELVLGPFINNTICQYSISFDVVFTSIATCAYMISQSPASGIWFTLLTPFLSIATTFPAFLGLSLLQSKQPSNKKQKLK